MMHRLILSALVAVLVMIAPASAQTLASFKTGSITIETAAGPKAFAVELATDDVQRAQGLMWRRTLAPDAGMVFIYTEPQEIQMWMRNTLIPLDMVFVRADCTIANIHERAVPQSLETIPSDGLVETVVELNGGTAARLGIKPGGKVTGPGVCG